MPLRLAGLSVLTICLLLVPAPATAGGWWASIQLDKDPVAVGERMTARASVVFASREEAEALAQEGGYHAYLVRGVDRERLDEVMATGQPGAWWTVPPTAIHLAELELSGTERNVADVHATFTVPDVEPGLYGLMFCSQDCAEPLADVIPRLDIPLHEDPLLADIARSLESPDGGSRLSEIERRLGEVYENVGALRRQVGALDEPAPSPSPTSAPTTEVAPATAPIELSQSTSEQNWLVVAAAFVAGATMAGLVVSIRQRRGGPHVPPEPRVLVADAESLPEPVGAPPP